jgi:hypothetical protein
MRDCRPGLGAANAMVARSAQLRREAAKNMARILEVRTCLHEERT